MAVPSLFLVFLIVEEISLKGKNARTGRFISSEASFRPGAFSGIFRNACKEKVSCVKQGQFISARSDHISETLTMLHGFNGTLNCRQP